jgi:Nitrile hydratase, alpha chain
MALNRQEMEALIVQHAWKDDAFRDEFIADPKATIEKYSGQKLPAEYKFVAHAEDDKTIHFVIPPKPANTDELSDEDLEKVAGGIDIIGGIIIGVAAVMGATLAVGGADAGTRLNHGW